MFPRKVNSEIESIVFRHSSRNNNMEVVTYEYSQDQYIDSIQNILLTWKN